MRIPHALLAVLFSLGAHCAAGAAPGLGASASVTWVENITRSPFVGGIRDAAVYDADFTAEWRNQISRDVSLQVETTAGLESCPRYDGLDRTLVGARVAVRRKLGLGSLAHVVSADLSYTGHWYRESLRNATRLVAGLSWTKRWDDRWQTVLAADYMGSNGRTRVYDYRHRGLSFETRYDVSERWQIAAGFKREWGEQMTYAWLGGGGATFPYVYQIWKNTTEVPTYGKAWYAYTMDAHADSVWFSVSPALGDSRSLPFRFEQVTVVARGESYRCRMISLSFVQRF